MFNWIKDSHQARIAAIQSSFVPTAFESTSSALATSQPKDIAEFKRMISEQRYKDALDFAKRMDILTQQTIPDSVWAELQEVTGDESCLTVFDSRLEKGGKKAVLGEKRMFGGREYIKTADGWKFHGKGTGAKAKEHVEKHSDHEHDHGIKEGQLVREAGRKPERVVSINGNMVTLANSNQPIHISKLYNESGESVLSNKKEDLISEHERLVKVLDSPSHKDDKEEAQKQKKELDEMKEDKLVGQDENGKEIRESHTKLKQELLGVTKSGKKVHSNFDHPDHKNFTAEDHKEAQRLHDTEKKYASNLGQKIGHEREMTKHHIAARQKNLDSGAKYDYDHLIDNNDLHDEYLKIHEQIESEETSKHGHGAYADADKWDQEAMRRMDKKGLFNDKKSKPDSSKLDLSTPKITKEDIKKKFEGEGDSLEDKVDKEDWNKHGRLSIGNQSWMVDKSRNSINGSFEKDGVKYDARIDGNLKDGYTLSIFKDDEHLPIEKRIKRIDENASFTTHTKAKSKPDAIKKLVKESLKWGNK